MRELRRNRRDADSNVTSVPDCFNGWRPCCGMSARIAQFRWRGDSWGCVDFIFPIRIFGFFPSQKKPSFTGFSFSTAVGFGPFYFNSRRTNGERQAPFTSIGSRFSPKVQPRRLYCCSKPFPACHLPSQTYHKGSRCPRRASPLPDSSQSAPHKISARYRPPPEKNVVPRAHVIHTGTLDAARSGPSIEKFVSITHQNFRVRQPIP